jgi:hypothetical protein
MFTSIARVLVASALVVGLTGSAAMPAAANAGDVIRVGVCSGRSDARIKLSLEHRRIEVQFEVDSNRVGQIWRVRIFHDGFRIFPGLRLTRGPSGSFEVRLLARNLRGVDRFRARAHNPASGERCGARAAI